MFFGICAATPYIQGYIFLDTPKPYPSNREHQLDALFGQGLHGLVGLARPYI